MLLTPHIIKFVHTKCYLAKKTEKQNKHAKFYNYTPEKNLTPAPGKFKRNTYKVKDISFNLSKILKL